MKIQHWRQSPLWAETLDKGWSEKQILKKSSLTFRKMWVVLWPQQETTKTSINHVWWILKKVSSVASLLKPVSQWQVSFPGGSEVKNPPASEGNVGLIPGSGRSPGGGNGCKFPFLPGKSHGQRCPMGYRLQKRKESDTTEALSTTTNWWQATLLQVRLLAA